jgi:hypothetical protein
MQSFSKKSLYSIRADANALGGFLDEPFQKIIPTLTPVSLPPVGGFATARSEAFNLEEVVSCSSAYTRVSGMEHAADGSISILVTAVVADLNLLEVVTAERIVTQVSISIPAGNGMAKFSFAGSRFEGLQLAGRHTRPKLNSALHHPESDAAGHGLSLTWREIQSAGQEQAGKLIECFKASRDKDALLWAQKRHGWMASESLPKDGGYLLCSLVDGLEGPVPGESCGHIVEIPGFGRIFLGEMRVSRDSIQVVAIRAELGCPFKGKVGIAAGGGGGQGEN